jgi:hypothetical protein
MFENVRTCSFGQWQKNCLDGWIVTSFNYMQHVHFAEDWLSLTSQEFNV